MFGEWALMRKYGGGPERDRWDHRIRNTTRYFLWGDYSRRILAGTGRFQQDQLEVVGAPRTDYFLTEATAEEKKHWEPDRIGLVSDYMTTNPYTTSFLDIFQKIDLTRSAGESYYPRGRDVEDRIWTECTWVKLWLELFDDCQERGEKIHVRIHPGEEISNYRYLRRKYKDVLSFEGQALPFESWLERTGVFLGFNSTTFFEAVAAGKPAISLEGLAGPRLREHTTSSPPTHYPIMDHLPTPTSRDELFALIAQIREGRWKAEEAYGPELRALLQEVYQFPRTTSSLAAVVRSILSNLGQEPPRRRWIERLEEIRVIGEAQLLEFFTFRVRRDPIISPWFPLEASRYERLYARQILRYLRAAAAFPAVPPPSVLLDRGEISLSKSSAVVNHAR